MTKSIFKRILCGFLTVLMVMGTLATGVFATKETATDSGTETPEKTTSSLEEIKAILDTLDYNDYRASLGDVKKASDTFTVNFADAYVGSEGTDKDKDVVVNTEEQTNKDYKKAVKSVYLPEKGSATFKINVKKAGLYVIDIEYFSVEAKATSIERMLYIDGKIPFSEARYLTMPKTWVDNLEEGGKFKQDLTENDIRPTKAQVPTWNTYTLSDSTGFVVEPLEVYFTEGEHTLTFEAVREPVVFSTMTFKPYEELPTYEEVLAEYKANGYKPVEDAKILVEAEISSDPEHPILVSEQTIYPLNDRSSPITSPQDPAKTKLNTIGSDKWKTAGQWIKYTIKPEKTGLYELAMRFKQSELEGMYVSRRIYINGEIPFEEASYLEFLYKDSWQNAVISSKDGTPYQFYFEAGKEYEIKFEVVLGSMNEVLNRVNNVLTLMNESYLKILMITGSDPDEFRDYNFSRLVPEAINSLVFSARELKAVGKMLEDITGQTGSHVATLNKIVILLERMTSDEKEVAKNLINLKTYIGTLGTWLLDSRAQPLEIDYFVFQTPGTKLPKANSNFFQTLWFETKAFVLSFFIDYSTLGATVEIDSDSKVEVWTTIGREKSKIMRQLVDSDFMQNNEISVEIKLVSGGVLQSTLAGIGPDIAFLASADCVNYAIRDAVLPLNDMEGFDEVMKRFPKAAKDTLTLYGKTYGLPNTMTFLMMFYRMDILADLNVEVPRTWDELKNIIPVLQTNNMTIGFPSKIAGTKLFLYQMGGEMYADDGKRINLSSNVALSAFTELTDLFQSYRFPLTYEAANRFRTGEMPILISDYISLYNQLTVFAPEIDGLWEFISLPGFVDENGEINNCSVVTTEGVCLMKGAEDNPEDCWKFLEWFTRGNVQANYSNELVAVVGQSSKNATANTEALSELPWSSREYENLMDQFEKTVGITEYPGGYIITRYVDFAFMDVYNDGANATEAMLDYVTEINKEITRKRKEFGFDYLEISYSNSADYIESE